MVKATSEIDLTTFENLDGEKFIGIADCHGIESFLPYETHKKELFYLKIRAMSNRQRHAVAYLVALDPLTVSLISGYIEKQKFKRALQELKTVRAVYFPDNYANSWALIPNSKLDPWRS